VTLVFSTPQPARDVADIIQNLLATKVHFTLIFKGY
jgi:hypothetical protein